MLERYLQATFNLLKAEKGPANRISQPNGEGWRAKGSRWEGGRWRWRRRTSSAGLAASRFFLFSVVFFFFVNEQGETLRRDWSELQAPSSLSKAEGGGGA